MYQITLHINLLFFAIRFSEEIKATNLVGETDSQEATCQLKLPGLQFNH